MNITLARSAGFCFGVGRAVESVGQMLSEGKKVCTLGPLIHNPLFVKSLEEQGVYVTDSISGVKDGYELVVRTHGITKKEKEEIAASGIPYFDATCPFVSKIHRIVEEQSAKGNVIFIAGDPSHPEVIGISSCVSSEYYVFSSAGELENFAKSGTIPGEKEVSLVSQTTFSEEEYKKCEKIAKKHYTSLKFFDTICNATALRQKEAAALSRINDAMIVIGGRNSSNTRKLYELCSRNCRTYLIESASELNNFSLSGIRSIGVTAGASTPDSTIKEVIRKMSELNLNNEAAEVNGQAEAAAAAEDTLFADMLEESCAAMNNDSTVIGTVMHVTPNEVQVEIAGRKQTGYVALEDYSADPNANPANDLKVGDEIKLVIMKTNDAEGTIKLSKKLYDARKYWDTIADAEKEGTILEGTVVEAIGKGLIVYSNGVRVFVPASHSTVPKDGSLDTMLNKTVSFKIIDVDARRRSVVGSIRIAMNEQRKAKAEAFWAQAEEGQVYTGTVVGLTDYGAFVDIGANRPGMVHRTELTWKHIKHPSDVVSVGDVIEVYIKGLDRENDKISLGCKKVEDNPWEILRRDYPIGSEIEVKVVRMTTFGAFAEIFPGLEGLIHISQIAYERIEKPQDVLEAGQVVKVKILDIDFDKKRISLSIKALLPAPEKPAAVEEAPAEKDDAPAVYSIDELKEQAEAEAAAPAAEE